MKNFATCIIFVTLTVFGSITAWSNTVSIKGSATLPFKSSLFSSEPTSELRQEAINQGKLSAWRKYVSQFSGAKRDLYNKNSEIFINNLENYIIDVRVLDESVNKDSNTFVTTVRVNIDAGAVDSSLRENTAAGNQATGDGSTFAFVFVARELQSRQNFKDKVTNIRQAEQVEVVENKIAIDGASSSESLDQSSVAKTVTGGSTVQKRAKLNYQVSSSQDINASMNNLLTTAGFEVVEYDDVVSSCGGAERTAIMQEFSDNDEMSRESRNSAIGASRDCEVSLFAVGTLDVGLSDIDPVSGLQRVFVSTRAQVWSLEKRLPVGVASVGPVQYSGLGPDAQVATRNALNLAAEKSAKEIVAILNSKGIR